MIQIKRNGRVSWQSFMCMCSGAMLLYIYIYIHINSYLCTWLCKLKELHTPLNLLPIDFENSAKNLRPTSGSLQPSTKMSLKQKTSLQKASSTGILEHHKRSGHQQKVNNSMHYIYALRCNCINVLALHCNYTPLCIACIRYCSSCKQNKSYWHHGLCKTPDCVADLVVTMHRIYYSYEYF